MAPGTPVLKIAKPELPLPIETIVVTWGVVPDSFSSA
jgi:hypothetical protein